jgi:hypothetical protein
MRVVDLGDMHVGSRGALSINQSEIGKKIYRKWQEASSGEWSKPDILILGGDLIHGQNRKTSGFGAWTSDLLEQCDEATKLIQMWGAKKIFCVRGSGYHVDANNTGLQCEELIARNLNAELFPDGSGNRSGWHWYLTIEGITLHVEHFIQGSRYFAYKATPLAREMMQSKLNEKLIQDMTKMKTDIVVRHHGHSYICVKYRRMMGVVCPSWTVPDDFLSKQGALSQSPDIGFLAWDIKDKKYRFDDSNIIGFTEVQPMPLTVVMNG